MESPYNEYNKREKYVYLGMKVGVLTFDVKFFSKK